MPTGQVWESGSEGEGPKQMSEVCKTPPRNFRVEFFISDSFDKGFQVGAKIDGVLCMTKADAMNCFGKRMDELWAKWEEMKTKI